MNTFEVKDMTCGYCSSTITKAVKALDPGATVRIDISAHRVRITSDTVPAGQWSDVIRQADYTPVAIQDVAQAATPTAAPVRKGGCCCG